MPEAGEGRVVVRAPAASGGGVQQLPGGRVGAHRALRQPPAAAGVHKRCTLRRRELRL